MQPVAHVRIRQADHRATQHVGQAFDDRLDLGGIDVDPADQDHVGAAVGNVEIAVRVDPAHVAETVGVVRDPGFRTDIGVARADAPDLAEADVADLARR